MILKSKETKETRIFLGEEERRRRRRRRKKGPIESRVHELKTRLFGISPYKIVIFIRLEITSNVIFVPM